MRQPLLLAVAALTCPCHLPLLAALLVGTAMGSFIAGNIVLLFAAFGLLFAGALWLWSRQPDPAGRPSPPLPSPALRERGEGGSSPLSRSAGEGPGVGAVPACTATSPRVQILKTPGCASCAGLERSWEALRPQYGDRVQVEIVDLLEQPELAERYGVLRSPAVVIDDRLRAQGAVDAARLRRLLDEALDEQAVTTTTKEGAYA